MAEKQCTELPPVKRAKLQKALGRARRLKTPLERENELQKLRQQVYQQHQLQPTQQHPQHQQRQQSANANKTPNLDILNR